MTARPDDREVKAEPSSSDTREAFPTAPVASGSPPHPANRSHRFSKIDGRLRDEHLNGQLFDSILEAQVLTEDWGIDYTENRPHGAHRGLSLAAFAEARRTANQLQLAQRVDQETGSGHLSRRDAADVLGVSRQRDQQLLASWARWHTPGSEAQAVTVRGGEVPEGDRRDLADRRGSRFE